MITNRFSYHPTSTSQILFLGRKRFPGKALGLTYTWGKPKVENAQKYAQMVYGIEYREFGSRYTDLSSFYRERINDDCYTIFGPTGNIWGSGFIGPSMFAKDNKRLFLHSVDLLPSIRGHGVGRWIMEGLIDKARKIDGIKAVYLFAEHDVAISLYKSLGFKATGYVNDDNVEEYELRF